MSTNPRPSSPIDADKLAQFIQRKKDAAEPQASAMSEAAPSEPADVFSNLPGFDAPATPVPPSRMPLRSKSVPSVSNPAGDAVTIATLNTLRNLAIAIVALMVLMLVLQVVTPILSLLVSDKPSAEPLIRWEYQIISPADARIKSEMAAAGANGWELVCARRVTGQFDIASYEMILKRPKR